MKTKTSGTAVGTLAYNQANQVTTSGYAYDGAGNQVSNPYDTTIGYNDAGQMTSASALNEQLAYAGAGGVRAALARRGRHRGICGS